MNRERRGNENYYLPKSTSTQWKKLEKKKTETNVHVIFISSTATYIIPLRTLISYTTYKHRILNIIRSSLVEDQRWIIDLCKKIPRMFSWKSAK